jgi:hypothetical protein
MLRHCTFLWRGVREMAIEWTDEDPATGAKRSVRAEKFARQWRFKVRIRRKTIWAPVTEVTREMWESLLDALERRLPRREGVTDDDVTFVRRAIAQLGIRSQGSGIRSQESEASSQTTEETP